MKWPASLMLIRHDVSTYNLLKEKKNADPTYKYFLEEYASNPNSKITRELARIVWRKFDLGVSDAETPLADNTGERSFQTGQELRKEFPVPDVVVVSPYLRT